MAIADELTDLQTYLSNAYDNIQAKGGTLPQNKNMYNLADAIATISQGQIIIPPDAGTLTAINVTQLPNKTSYIVGEYFNPAGCVVIATYTNTTIDVSSVCTFVVNTPLQGTDTSVQVSYEGLTTSFSISVSYPPVPAPSGTYLLMHLNGNLINEVDGQVGATGTYHQSVGKWGFGQETNGSSYLLGFFNRYPVPNPVNWGFGWWTLCGSGNYGNWGFKNASGSQLFSVINKNSNGLVMQPSRAFNVSNLVIDNQIPTSQIFNKWVYYAVQIRGTSIYCYINGTLTSHADFTFEGNYDLNEIRCTEYANSMILDEIIIAPADVYHVNNAPWTI